ncbi:MAG TPA: aminomethyl-transferring glycine dehydrogenase [Thermoanaerobaculia bacterium]|nr:aminomethyl-transferring glycine dehydrogenase [Thermoanaerobaculia bacterium]
MSDSTLAEAPAANAGRPPGSSPAPPPAAERPSSVLDPTDDFPRRHLGSNRDEIAAMLDAVGAESLDGLVADAVPRAIRLGRELPLSPVEGFAAGRPPGERELLDRLAGIAAANRVCRSFLGLGYSDTVTPPVIQRNILENPGWYTQYTPYQAEISQGRLEALLNFQTMVADLTGLPIANSSLLDEATAAAEAMHLCYAAAPRERADGAFFVADHCFPQTRAVVETRAEAQGIEVRVGDPATADLSDVVGVLLQMPAEDGRLLDLRPTIERARQAGARVVIATDLLALALLPSPGELGADVAVGSAQRFGVPLGFGGPHAAFMAAKDELKRLVPGRLIGVSRDRHGDRALRMALQTREQHIRREKATSNICTAQVLLAIMAGMYAVYHGPEGLRAIARRVHALAAVAAEGLRRLGFRPADAPFFDTLRVDLAGRSADEAVAAAARRGMNLRRIDEGTVGIAFDEAKTAADVEELLAVFAELAGDGGRLADLDDLAAAAELELPEPFRRQGDVLVHPVFRSYHQEHEMLRYLKRLEGRDLSLAQSMIPLGSCTMKLNATAEMMPISWPGFARLHPFAPADQTAGYRELFATLERWLAEITGFAATTLQPNAGSQGELTGLLLIRAWHRSRGEAGRDVCLIPVSAHGTNPASAVMAGMRVVPVACDEAGNIDVGDLERRAAEHADRLAALMVTYPSTHGVFEERIREICDVVHRHGGQVYLDGANMNAQVGLARPADYGADVCHLNLHKTFCIPHGGGGPGMGPVCCAEHLAPFLPGHPLVEVGGERAIGPVSAAPWGSASILPISWAYVAMMGRNGLTAASELAILNANYMARRLSAEYRVLYSGRNGRVAHEFILDLRPFKASAGVEAEDVAKRLMDYGFHAPTMSFPVAGTLMIEPTESESKAELDRFCEALLAIREEIRAIEEGRLDRADNPLKMAPHTAAEIASDAWSHPYPREQAAFPLPWVRGRKFWPAVGRVDNPWGDRNLICVCPPMEAYGEAGEE